MWALFLLRAIVWHMEGCGVRRERGRCLHPFPFRVTQFSSFTAFVKGRKLRGAEKQQGRLLVGRRPALFLSAFYRLDIE